VPFGPLMIFAVLAGVWMFNGFWPAVPLVLLTLFVVRRVLWWRYRGWRH
jgi:hypothetical protein